MSEQKPTIDPSANPATQPVEIAATVEPVADVATAAEGAPTVADEAASPARTWLSHAIDSLEDACKHVKAAISESALKGDASKMIQRLVGHLETIEQHQAQLRTLASNPGQPVQPRRL